MCQRITCQKCGKPTFAGCGRHIEQVLGDVPKEGRCQCREAARREASERPSLLSSLLGSFAGRRS
ncbi:MAG TPA: hypothetical protein VHE30_13835 [Polyangiaceae bacterium]|nr:hypothetical protein [Polyangiaceae bacterium]